MPGTVLNRRGTAGVTVRDRPAGRASRLSSAAGPRAGPVTVIGLRAPAAVRPTAVGGSDSGRSPVGAYGSIIVPGWAPRARGAAQCGGGLPRIIG
eukprot:148599-Hanusia_phi.AAC.1